MAVLGILDISVFSCLLFLLSLSVSDAGLVRKDISERKHLTEDECKHSKQTFSNKKQ